MANDSVRTIGEVGHVADSSEWVNSAPTQIGAVIYQGQPVIFNLAQGPTTRDYRVRRYNGTNWVDLGFPTTTTFANGASPVPRIGHASITTDDTTIWLAMLVDETVDYGAYLYGTPGSTWTTGGVYVFAYSGAGWTLIYYRAGPTLNRFATGPLSGVAGGHSMKAASHDGAGYVWVGSLEFGNRGGTLTDPYTDNLCISTKLDGAGMMEEHFGINYGSLDRSSLYTGSYYGADQPEDSTTQTASIGALWTDAGYPILVANLFTPAPRLSAVQADTFTELQALDSGQFAMQTNFGIHDGRAYLGLSNDDQVAADLYPEEIGSASFNRLLIYTIPMDATSPFEALTDRNGEDVALAKNPLQSAGPADFSGETATVAAVTGDHRPWIAFDSTDGSGNSHISLFVLNDGCPYTGSFHGRYAWDYAKLGTSTITAQTGPARPGDFNDSLTGGFTSVFDPAAARIWVAGWAKDFAASSTLTYLRVWYFDLCNGCLACAGGLHVWQRI